jgi:hypothetical protein
VCLEADKTASRGKTKAEICGENRRKRRKIRIGGNINQESGVFPQPVQARTRHLAALTPFSTTAQESSTP